MLISQLGKTRRDLLASLEPLSDAALNRVLPGQRQSIAQVIHHLSAVESETARTILQAIPQRSDKVPEHNEAYIVEHMANFVPASVPPDGFFTKAALIRLLEESRFRDLQQVFNETHEQVLTEKSMQHPAFGAISLKNLVDFIWIHEARHTRQIEMLKNMMAEGPDTSAS